MGRDTHDPRPTHQLATESYDPDLDAFPGFDEYQAIVRCIADTLDAEVAE